MFCRKSWTFGLQRPWLPASDLATPAGGAHQPHHTIRPQDRNDQRTHLVNCGNIQVYSCAVSCGLGRSCGQHRSISVWHGVVLETRPAPELNELLVHETILWSRKPTVLVEYRTERPLLHFADTPHYTASAMLAGISNHHAQAEPPTFPLLPAMSVISGRF